MEENSKIIEATVIDDNNAKVDPNKKKPFYKTFKFYLYITIFLGFILAILFVKGEFEVYRNAQKYKAAYTIVQEQLKQCSNIKVEPGQDPSVIVHYCDQLKVRFKSIEKENL